MNEETYELLQWLAIEDMEMAFAEVVSEFRRGCDATISQSL